LTVTFPDGETDPPVPALAAIVIGRNAGPRYGKGGACDGQGGAVLEPEPATLGALTGLQPMVTLVRNIKEYRYSGHPDPHIASHR